MKINFQKNLLTPVITVLLLALLLPITSVYAGDNDGRLNPDHAEYYTVYCVNDNVDVYLATGSLLNRVRIGRVMSLSIEGGSMDIGRGMTMSRWHDDITISGSNGNFAPSTGYKTFSFYQCLGANQSLPDILPTGSGSNLESESSSTTTTTTTSTTTGTPWTGTSWTVSSTYAPPRDCVHIVQAGETVFSIANRYRVSVYGISALNHLLPSRIFAGQYLTIPGCTVTGTTTPVSVPVQVGNGRTHVLLSGQTAYSVARAYGVSLSELMRVNNIVDPTRLPAGMVLKIP